MFDLRDRLTLVIPTKIDTPDRLRNLGLTLDWHRRHLDCNIIVVESDTQRRALTVSKKYGAKYVFDKLEEGHMMSQTKCLNIGARLVNTPAFAKVDVDCIIIPEQYERATHFINKELADLIYPYDGHFLNIIDPVVDSFNHYTKAKEEGKDIEEQDTKFGVELSKVHNSLECWSNKSIGGIHVYNNKTYWQYGGANEMFEGWGFEDNEIDSRFNKLGARIMRTQGCLYHLAHERNWSNKFYNERFSNEHICKTIKSMNKDQLELLVKCWEWCK